MLPNKSVKKIKPSQIFRRKICFNFRQLNNLKSSDIVSTHNQRVSQLNSEIAQATQRLHERETEGKNQLIQAKIAERVGSLNQNVQNLRNRKDQVLSTVNENRTKLSNERNNLESLLNKLIDATKGNNSSKIA